MERSYRNILRGLGSDEVLGGTVNSPLALLLKEISQMASKLLNINGDQFLSWLDKITPDAISADAGIAATSPAARLADCVDELDGVLLVALEEISKSDNRSLTGAEAESFLIRLWQNTFTAVAAQHEQWLEQTFIRRGRAVIDLIYPDANERKRLYLYGFTPYIGRKFEMIAPSIRELLSGAGNYGAASNSDRLSLYISVGSLIADNRGFGFRVGESESSRELFGMWQTVLAWWMKCGNELPPEANKLRAWQRFVLDNFEFRLGVAFGAVVAQAWTDGAGDPLAIPSLAKWRQTTGLPWFGFWARELLRWGTLEPFVAFALAQGLAGTREEANLLRNKFVEWLQQTHETIEAEDLINPQFYLEWQLTFPRRESTELSSSQIDAELTGTNGRLGIYSVLPVSRDKVVSWIDASGFELARSESIEGKLTSNSWQKDFQLIIRGGRSWVQ